MTGGKLTIQRRREETSLRSDLGRSSALLGAVDGLRDGGCYRSRSRSLPGWFWAWRWRNASEFFCAVVMIAAFLRALCRTMLPIFWRCCLWTARTTGAAAALIGFFSLREVSLCSHLADRKSTRLNSSHRC